MLSILVNGEQGPKGDQGDIGPQGPWLGRPTRPTRNYCTENPSGSSNILFWIKGLMILLKLKVIFMPSSNFFRILFSG